MKKKLWLTYAWRDNEDKDVDFIVQELDKSDDVEVRFDRRQLVPGQRLWPQIGGFITDPKECDAWAILLTANSVKSQGCIEELCYALDRAISAKGEGFPVFALLHHVAPQDMPPALRIRLAISLEESDWMKRAEAAVKRISPGFVPQGITEFILTEHKTEEGYALEIRPRLERISPFSVAVDSEEAASGNVTACGPAPAGMPPMSFAAFGYIESEVTLSDGTLVHYWQANNEATSTLSYYLLYKRRPRRVWFGHPKRIRMQDL